MNLAVREIHLDHGCSHFAQAQISPVAAVVDTPRRLDRRLAVKRGLEYVGRAVRGNVGPLCFDGRQPLELRKRQGRIARSARTALQQAAQMYGPPSAGVRERIGYVIAEFVRGFRPRVENVGSDVRIVAVVVRDELIRQGAARGIALPDWNRQIEAAVVQVDRIDVLGVERPERRAQPARELGTHGIASPALCGAFDRAKQEQQCGHPGGEFSARRGWAIDGPCRRRDHLRGLQRIPCRRLGRSESATRSVDGTLVAARPRRYGAAWSEQLPASREVRTAAGRLATGRRAALLGEQHAGVESKLRVGRGDQLRLDVGKLALSPREFLAPRLSRRAFR